MRLPIILLLLAGFLALDIFDLTFVETPADDPVLMSGTFSGDTYTTTWTDWVVSQGNYALEVSSNSLCYDQAVIVYVNSTQVLSTTITGTDYYFHDFSAAQGATITVVVNEIDDEQSCKWAGEMEWAVGF